MIENNPQDVSSAFEILLEEVEAEIEFVNNVGAKAFSSGNHERAKEALERVQVLKTFRDRISELRREWDEIAAKAEQQDDEETKEERRQRGRLRKGIRTAEAEYYVPILNALVEMGGSAKVNDVLERVFNVMKPRLKPVDLEVLPSNKEPRWRNAAQWARHTLVTEGLLIAESPHGVWEISDKGRRWLKERAS